MCIRDSRSSAGARGASATRLVPLPSYEFDLRGDRVDVALANGASGSKFVLRLDGGRLTVFRALRSGAADVRDVVGTVNLPF